MIIFLSN